MAKRGYITVDKGSVTVNGVSLTVCNPTDDTFQFIVSPVTLPGIYQLQKVVHTFFTSTLRSTLFVLDHPADILADNIKFQVDNTALPESMEIGMLVGIWDNRHLKSIVSRVAYRQADTVDRNRTLVEADKLERILEAGRLAPSACNAQPWRFVVVTDPSLAEKVGKAAAGLGMNKFAKDAPVHILVVEESANITSRLGGKWVFFMSPTRRAHSVSLRSLIVVIRNNFPAFFPDLLSFLFHRISHRFSRIISSGSRWKKLLICVNLRNLW